MNLHYLWILKRKLQLFWMTGFREDFSVYIPMSKLPLIVAPSVPLENYYLSKFEPLYPRMLPFTFQLSGRPIFEKQIFLYILFC